MDASFAPLIQFRNESQGWVRSYESAYRLMMMPYGGHVHV
jgi:hypothetical protein